MKSKLWFGMILGVAPLLAMCTSSSQVVPISKICEYDGAHSGDTVKVKCTGIGNDMGSATIDAKKAATWYVVSKLVRTPEERQRFSSISTGFYKRYNTFLSKASVEEDTFRQDDDGRAHVNARLHVNREAIAAYLKDNGVLDLKKIREKVDNPVVAVSTKWRTKDPRWEAFLRASANEFLTARQYNTKDLESGSKKLNKLSQTLLKLDGVPVDKRFRAAMSMGADVFVEVAAWNESRGASTKGAARAKVYETTTGRLIGDAPAFGKEYPRTNQSEFRTVKEAVQNAVEKSLVKAMDYWRSDAAKGNRYYIFLAGKLNAVEDMGDLMSLRLKKMKGVSGFKRALKTDSRMVVQFQSKMDSVEMSLTLKQTLREAPGVKSIKIPLTTRKYFFVLVNNNTDLSKDSDSLPPGL